MKRLLKKFPLFTFAFANSLYISYANISSDIIIITVFLLAMGYLLYKVKTELLQARIPIMSANIIGNSIYYTLIAFCHIQSVAFILLAFISFLSGYYVKEFEEI